MGRRQINIKRKLKEGIAVIGEGRTEQYYLKHLKDVRGYKYAIRPYLFDCITLKDAEKIIDNLLEEDYGLIVFFTDFDTVVNQSRQQAFSRFKAKYEQARSVLICESMPSIEYWFILHFRNTTQPFINASQAEAVLKRDIPGYDKSIKQLGNKKWVEEMCNNGGLNNAIKRADKGLLQKKSGSVGAHFPFTKVQFAIQAFENEK